jgi:hypothetical protein
LSLTLASPPDDLLATFQSLHLGKVLPAQESNFRTVHRALKEVKDQQTSLEDRVDKWLHDIRRNVREVRDLVRAKIDLHTNETYATLGFPVVFTETLDKFLKGEKRTELMKVIINEELKQLMRRQEIEAATAAAKKRRKSVSYLGNKVLDALFSPAFIVTHNCFTPNK